MMSTRQVLAKDYRELPLRVLVNPVDASRPGIVGMSAEVVSPQHRVWMLVIDGATADQLDVAQMVALHMLNAEANVVRTSFMPYRPPSVVYFPNGIVRIGRNRTLPRWALEEVRRIAALLLEQHLDYVGELIAVAKRQEAPRFTMLPTGFVFTDPTGISRVGPGPPDVALDLSQSPGVRLGIRWDQVVRLDYRRNRYMRHLSDRDLAQRTMDIVGNIHVLNSKGEVTPDNAEGMWSYWSGLLAEIIEETHLRFGAYPAGWKDGFLHGVQRVGSLDGRKYRPFGELKPPFDTASAFTVKYGQMAHLRQTLETGIVRVAPASFYNDPSLNGAIKDNELEADLDLDVFGVGGFGGLRGSEVAHAPFRQKVRKRLTTNYYVYCLSTRLNRRLLLDFEADAALVIHDRAEFLRRLHAAMMSEVPTWNRVDAEIKYYDPLNVTQLEVDVLTWKHFRYAYQKEHRCAWIPGVSQSTLDPLFVNMGSLRDIADIVEAPPVMPS